MAILDRTPKTLAPLKKQKKRTAFRQSSSHFSRKLKLHPGISFQPGCPRGRSPSRTRADPPPSHAQQGVRRADGGECRTPSLCQKLHDVPSKAITKGEIHINTRLITARFASFSYSSRCRILFMHLRRLRTNKIGQSQQVHARKTNTPVRNCLISSSFDGLAAATGPVQHSLSRHGRMHLRLQVLTYQAYRTGEKCQRILQKTLIKDPILNLRQNRHRPETL